jgi:hypothetical protein
MNIIQLIISPFRFIINSLIKAFSFDGPPSNYYYQENGSYEEQPKFYVDEIDYIY